MSHQFSLRGYEFHSGAMWQWSQVERAIGLMERLDLNALVFHQNDLVDQLVFPEAYFSQEEMWRRNPVRMHTIFNNRHYVAKVVRALKSRGMQFYPEVKELWYPDGLTELYPQALRGGGRACPFDPFWWEFLRAKYGELVRILPDIAGVIMSAGTRESRISIAAAECTCEHCRGREAADWYERLIAAIYEPLQRAGKTLVVRDFSYSAANQRTIIEAAGRVSSDIVISLKNTPHDYYPTFPNNPSIGNCGAHPQWVEFDGWGQFFGLGVFPCSIVEDIRGRLRHCASRGVSGVWMRTDWEVITEAGIQNSLNLVNLFGFARMALNQNYDGDAVYREWCEYGLFSPLKSGSVAQEPVRPQAAEGWRAMRDLMTAGWEITERSQYVRGHLFNEDDQYCNSVARSFDMLVHIHGRDQWEPGASLVLDATPDNLSLIAEEKALATRMAKALQARFAGNPAGLPDAAHAELTVLLELFTLYVRGFEFCAAGVFAAKRLERTRADADRAVLQAAIAQLGAFKREIQARLAGTEYPHYIYWLLDGTRIHELIEDLHTFLGE